jgi:hypothetical protein
MKSQALLILFFLCSLRTFGQFGPVIYIDTVSGKTIGQLQVADLDGDNRQDIVVANHQWPFDHLTYYVQQSNGGFQLFDIPAADSLTNLEYIVTGDVLHDGQTEILAVYGFPWQISMFVRQEDQQYKEVVLDDSLDLTTQLLLRDFNHDGIIDLLSLQHTEIVLYLAITPGQFEERRVIHSGTEFYAIDVGYYNQDTLLDVSVASDGFDILLNDGTGHFEMLESPHIGLTFRLQSADLDLDGDTDIAAFESLRGILFYANDGSGHFLKQDTILLSTDIFDAYVLDDMDCDGDIDAYTSIPQPGWVVWVENDGTGHFPVFHELHFQSGELIRAVALGDFDHDQTPDPVWGNFILGARLNECVAVDLDEVQEINPSWQVYPNPAVGIFYVQNTSDTQLSFRLFDLHGSLVYQTSSVDTHQIREVSGLQPGMYLIQVWDKQKMRGSGKITVLY